ncbi:MAG: hypothetical protein R2737_12370 [Candidatus Nanopelagicales bacterium]
MSEDPAAAAPDQASPSGPAAPSGPAGPERLRFALADYVRGAHQAYLDAAAVLPPAERARLPLLAAGRITVVAVGTSHLHLLATTEALPAPQGPEVELADELPGLAWTVRFVDPVVLPAVGLVDESAGPRPDEVRRLLGVRTHLYHLVVPPGASLTPHHAGHAGTGLAHAHAAAARDFEAIRAHAPRHEALVEEMHGAAVAGLPRAQALLALAIAPGDDGVRVAADAAEPDPDLLRRALLAAVRAPSHAEVAQP